MRRILLVLSVAALMAAMTVALSGAALAAPGNAKGSGGHVEKVYEEPYCEAEEEECGVTFTGGGGGGDKGGGGCTTNTGTRECGSGEGSYF